MSTTVDVWYARPDRLAADLDSFRATLSPDERDRLARFLSNTARELFLIGRGIARARLGARFGVAPSACRFSYEGTRPRLVYPPPPGGFDFNISHTSGLVAVVLADGEPGMRVGIDVEAATRSWHPELPARFFSAEEAKVLQSLEEPRRQRHFYALWTLKEAYLKARGDGLAVPLDGFTVTVSEEAVPSIEFSPLLPDDPSSWQLTLREPVPGYLLAVAVSPSVGNAIALHEFSC